MGDVIAWITLDRHGDVAHSLPKGLVDDLERLLGRALIEPRRKLHRSDVRGLWDELRAEIAAEQLKERRSKRR